MAGPNEVLEENDATPKSRADAAGARHRSRGDVGDAGDADVAGAHQITAADAAPAVEMTSAAVDSSSDTSPRKSKSGSGAGLGKSG